MHLPHNIACAVVGLALTATSLYAQTDTFVTIEGETVTGQFRGLSDVTPTTGGKVKIHSKSGEDQVIELDVLESIQLGGASKFVPRTDKGERIWLRSGLTLAAKYQAAKSQAVKPPAEKPQAEKTMKAVFDVAGTTGSSSFPIPNLSAIQFQTDIEEDGGFSRALGEPSATQDLVFLWNRTRSKIVRLPTQVLGVSTEGFEISFRNREQQVPATQIYGIVFGTENGIRANLSSLPAVTVSLKDGPSLRGKILEWSKETCKLSLAEGAVLNLPTLNIAGVDIRSSRVAYLSSLEPTQVEQVSAFDRKRAWLRDQSPRGEGIQLGGKTYRRGICLIPRTSISYKLTGDFDTFEASVGIDDRSSRQAHAIIRIKADGKVVFDGEPFTLGMAPKVVRIPLAGIKTLTLETDFGKNFDLGDHCVFAGARLLKN